MPAVNKLSGVCKVMLIKLQFYKYCMLCIYFDLTSFLFYKALKAVQHAVRCVLLLDLCTRSCCPFCSHTHTGCRLFLLSDSSKEFKNIFLNPRDFLEKNLMGDVLHAFWQAFLNFLWTPPPNRAFYDPRESEDDASGVTYQQWIKHSMGERCSPAATLGVSPQGPSVPYINRTLYRTKEYSSTCESIIHSKTAKGALKRP